jgi:hypothetical protein
MTIIKSLHFNKEDEEDIRYHRVHRSKKNRKFMTDNSFILKKRRKFEKKEKERLRNVANFNN